MIKEVFSFIYKWGRCFTNGVRHTTRDMFRGALNLYDTGTCMFHHACGKAPNFVNSVIARINYMYNLLY